MMQIGEWARSFAYSSRAWLIAKAVEQKYRRQPGLIPQLAIASRCRANWNVSGTVPCRSSSLATHSHDVIGLVPSGNANNIG
jgi:hypothetical protein